MKKFKFALDNGTILTINPPSTRLYYHTYAAAKSDDDLFRAIAEICNNNDEKITITVDYILDNFTITDTSRFTTGFPRWIANERESDPN